MFCQQTPGLLKLYERSTLSLFDGMILNIWYLLFPVGFPKLKIRESNSFFDHQAGSCMKKNCFLIWCNVSEIGWWEILISLSSVWLSALSLLVYLSQDVWVNVLDHGLVIPAKTNMLVYPKELSKSLDCTLKTSCSSHCVSKSARPGSADLQCPGCGFRDVLCLSSTF